MMDTKQTLQCRHYVSYSGVKLPLNLITPLEDDDIDRRITYFRGYYNAQDQLLKVEKVVYGEIEFSHDYQYHADGRLKSAQLCEVDEAPRVLNFD